MIDVIDYINMGIKDDNSIYNELLDHIGHFQKSQQRLICYVKENQLSLKQKENLFFLIFNLYSFADEEGYDLDFGELYDYFLEEMFIGIDYYSKSYQYVKLLKNMKQDNNIVYNDIVDKINIRNPKSVCIAMAGTYLNDFYNYEDIMGSFFDKIIEALKFDNDYIIKKDFNHFMKDYLKIKKYRKFKKIFEVK